MGIECSLANKFRQYLVFKYPLLFFAIYSSVVLGLLYFVLASVYFLFFFLCFNVFQCFFPKKPCNMMQFFLQLATQFYSW